MTEPDLKPCPFCGGEVTTGKLIHTITHVDNEVKCPIEGMGFTNVTLWNTRPEPAGAETLQSRVDPWLEECFGAEISRDKVERNHRFLEEAIELVQSTGCTKSEALQLVDYVYGRAVGDPAQEVGGVMLTLAALCLANGLDMHQCGETELARVWTMVEKIREKQATKPKNSPLPQHTETISVQEAAQVLFEDPKAVRRLAAGGITGGSCGVSAILRAMAKEQAGS